jgi:hypothetical protein
MGVRLKVPFLSYLGGGGVLTFIGTAEGQAVYWSLDGFNPNTGLSCPAVGTLWQDVTLTGKSRLATNVYVAPTSDPGGIYDQVTVKAVLD